MLINIGYDTVDGEGSHSGSRTDTDSMEDEEVHGYCEEYDPECIAALQVKFPPFYFSTHGLSRPSTPVEDDKERWVF